MLDGFRGLAAVGVVLFHFKSPAYLHSFPLFQRGYLYVDFFFLLSGFVLAHAYGHRLKSWADAAPFLVRRIARLWPLHMATLGIRLAIELVGWGAYRMGVNVGRVPFTEDASPAALVTNVFMVHAWGMHGENTWNGPSWSISTEFGAYLLFMVLTLLLAEAPRRVAAVVVILASLGVLAFVAPEGIGSTFDFGLARCFAGFFTGTLLHAAWRRIGSLPQRSATAMEVGALLVGAAAVSLPLPSYWSLLTIAGLACCVLVFAFEQGAVSRALQRPSLRWLGERSYSIYLLQGPMFLVWYMSVKVGGRALGVDIGGHDGVKLAVEPRWLNDVALIGFVGVLLVLSDISWRRIEVPAGRALRQRFLPGRASR